MKPLNRAERNNAFLNFLLLFFITIGVLLAAVFFGIEVPFKQNEQLRQRVSVMQSERELSDSFNMAMTAAMNEISKFDQKNGSAEATRISVQMKIDQMRGLIKNMPDGDNSIYGQVIRNLADLNEAKTKIRILENGKN